MTNVPKTISPITFEEWIRHIFDHSMTDPAWHWSLDAEYLVTSPSEDVAFLTRLFEECEMVLRPYSDAQVYQGLIYMISPSCSEYMFELRNTEVPLSDRLRCIEAMGTLFKRCFAKRCSPHMCQSEMRVPPDEFNPLNGACYIWWDVLPLHGLIEHCPEHPDSAILDKAVISVIQRISKLDSVACQESALFGMAWSRIYYPEMGKVIDEFIENHPVLWNQLKPELRRTVFGKQ